MILLPSSLIPSFSSLPAYPDSPIALINLPPTLKILKKHINMSMRGSSTVNVGPNIGTTFISPMVSPNAVLSLVYVN